MEGLFGYAQTQQFMSVHNTIIPQVGPVVKSQLAVAWLDIVLRNRLSLMSKSALSRAGFHTRPFLFLFQGPGGYEPVNLLHEAYALF